MNSIYIIAYPPGGGGNHAKNIVELSERFKPHWPWDWVAEQTVGLAPYDKPLGVPGEVHSLPGRNLHAVFFDHIMQVENQIFLLHGHFGELALYREYFRSWPNTRWLIISIDQQIDRDLLRKRQNRLQYHPYWLDEEQYFMYQPELYQLYFNTEPDQIYQLPLNQFWHRDLLQSGTINFLEAVFETNITPWQAQSLHTKWIKLNGL